MREGEKDAEEFYHSVLTFVAVGTGRRNERRREGR
jgi:hypothetical protein